MDEKDYLFLLGAIYLAPHITPLTSIPIGILAMLFGLYLVVKSK